MRIGVFFLLFFLFLFAPLQAVCAPEVRITNGEWPPYLSKNLPEYGAASHIVKEAYSAVGIKVVYGFFPWKRSYKYAVAGEGEGQVWHGSLVWVHTEERAKLFDYSDIVIEDDEVLFHLKENSLQWESIIDLQGKRIGGTAHTVYPLFEKAEKKGLLEIHRAGNYETLFDRLLQKRIDAVPQVKFVGHYFLETRLTPEQNQRISFSPTVVDHRAYHLIFSKNVPGNRENLEQFNRGLQIIKENGTHGKIINNLKRGYYFVGSKPGS